ncbi:homeobox-containing protein 1-like [Larimichthys crocea]|uniref:homeobox-containing protein 1-like n=1 Tax=Larimichthys crocea TaxID=215358 RepID=UPI000F5F8075|nr:homeobox-containing protein 1-like [Larimichthys crocea]
MENQYPDEAKREEIANACNSVIQKPEAAILERHGIEVPSPSCHSNGEEGEMQEFADQVNHRFTEQGGQRSGSFKEQ